jgi:NDP-sugar pyrophosphorylase family protein
VIDIEDQSKGEVKGYFNKPKDFLSGKVDSCIYCFDYRVLDLIEYNETSLEAHLLPLLCHQGELYCRKLNGYWTDITSPKDLIFA